jgi:hypothetical protein
VSIKQLFLTLEPCLCLGYPFASLPLLYRL